MQLLGALGGHLVSKRALLGVTAAVLAWNGLDLLVHPFRGRPRAEPRLAPAVFFGFTIRVIGGAIGVILGTLRMPALLRAVGLDAPRGRRHESRGRVPPRPLRLRRPRAALEVDWPLLGAGLAGGLPGASLGARLTSRLSEESLRRALGLALLAIVIAFALVL